MLNLVAQPGETSGLRPRAHVQILAEAFPDLRFDVVLADPAFVPDPQALAAACARIGGELVTAPYATMPGPGPVITTRCCWGGRSRS